MPRPYEQIDWALAHRVNAGEGGLVVFPGIFGSPIDPVHAAWKTATWRSSGTGLWNRVLFDATRSWKFERRAGVGRRALPADRAPGHRGRGAGAPALGRVRPRRSVA